MKLIAITAIPLSLLAAWYATANQTGRAPGPATSNAEPEKITITRSRSQSSSIGRAEYFTGSANITELFPAKAPARVSGGRVTFQPGARTAWHTHPLGQILIVTAGTGWIQQWGGPKEEIRESDVVWIPSRQKHWHGATATASMTHIAIQEQLDGKAVEWMEKVTDGQYGGLQ